MDASRAVGPTAMSSSDDSSLSSSSSSWISTFCCQRGNEFFVEVDEEYVEDGFNLTGLRKMVPLYQQALNLILDVETDYNGENVEDVDQAAAMLYGLVHARFLLTSRGLSLMAQKYNAAEFGRCPRVYCEGQSVLPVGLADMPNVDSVKLFCPRCQDVYNMKRSRYGTLDGCYFGTTAAHLLLLCNPQFVPTPPKHSHTPRIYGFKIHDSATKHMPMSSKLKKKKKKKKRRTTPTPSAAGEDAAGDGSPTVGK